MGYPRYQLSQAFKMTQHAGSNVAITSTSFVAVNTALDIPLAAQVGDVIEASVSLTTQNQASILNLDAATVISGSVVNRFNPTSNFGNPGWCVRGNDYFPATGSTWYTLVAGDIANGLVTVRLLARIEAAGSRTILGQAVAGEPPIRFFAQNLGPVDPN